MAGPMIGANENAGYISFTERWLTTWRVQILLWCGPGKLWCRFSLFTILRQRWWTALLNNLAVLAGWGTKYWILWLSQIIISLTEMRRIFVLEDDTIVGGHDPIFTSVLRVLTTIPVIGSPDILPKYPQFGIFSNCLIQHPGYWFLHQLFWWQFSFFSRLKLVLQILESQHSWRILSSLPSGINKLPQKQTLKECSLFIESHWYSIRQQGSTLASPPIWYFCYGVFLAASCSTCSKQTFSPFWWRPATKILLTLHRI